MSTVYPSKQEFATEGWKPKGVKWTAKGYAAQILKSQRNIIFLAECHCSLPFIPSCQSCVLGPLEFPPSWKLHCWFFLLIGDWNFWKLHTLPLGINFSALPWWLPSATLSPTLRTDLGGQHLVFISNKSSVPLWSYTGIFRWPEGIRGTAAEIQPKA